VSAPAITIASFSGETSGAILQKFLPAETTVSREGTFEALVASFGTLDKSGDIIRPGAFTASLNRWRESGKRIPVIWSHQTNDPALVIGSADPHDARETVDGLVVKGKLNIDNNAAADHVYDLLHRGDVNGWSFGYRTIRQTRSKAGNELLELDLAEIGPTVTPANTAARTLRVKGDPTPERHPVPSHTELHTRLLDAGIIARPADLGQTFQQARDSLAGLNSPNGNHATDQKSDHTYCQADASDAMTKALSDVYADLDRRLTAGEFEPRLLIDKFDA
jgi:HK97 family phage prohead protease